MKKLILACIMFSSLCFHSHNAIASERFNSACEKHGEISICVVEDNKTYDRFVVVVTRGSISVSTLSRNPHLNGGK